SADLSYTLSLHDALPISQNTPNLISYDVTRAGGVERPSEFISGTDDGFVHFVAYTEPSDGTVPSTIRTDYIELEIELKPTADFRSEEHTSELQSRENLAC